MLAPIQGGESPMNKLLPLLAAPVALAMPAAAQDAQTRDTSPMWPVERSAAGCAVVRAGIPETGFGSLSVGYDAARDEVTVSTSEHVKTTLPPNGKIVLQIVFVDNGGTRHDDGWGTRTFTYTSNDDVYRFTSAFAGKNNVRQILADLGHSRRLGLLRNGEVLFDHDLVGLAPAIARLQDCAASAVVAK
jgi:hypothetical protein